MGAAGLSAEWNRVRLPPKSLGRRWRIAREFKNSLEARSTVRSTDLLISAQ
jgi:hypothetical protein